MQSVLTLIINNIPEVAREVTVPPGRFSIGRSGENDLVLNLAGLSRRHALISNVDGAVFISDCGSQNGTFVNGVQVGTSTELRDGDAISLGTVCEIFVNLKPLDEPHEGGRNVPAVSGSNDAGTFPTIPVVALVSVVAIMLAAIATIVVLKVKNGGAAVEPTPDHRQDVVATPTPISTSSSTRPCEGLTIRQIENASQQVIKRISTDPNDYAFPSDQSHLLKIKGTVEQFCGSAVLTRTIQRVKQSQEVIRDLSANQISPDLLTYAALAEDVDGTVDPLAIARQIAPKLIAVWKLFGDDHGDNALILLAAYKVGDVGRGTHPILGRMTRAGITRDTERNVWELYRKQGLTQAEYDFVIRFLACGMIANSPRQYGINLP